MIKEEKVQKVEELAGEAEESGAVVFADYRGLTVSEMAELRKKLSEIGADLKVVKNTLVKFALEKAKLPLSGQLTGRPGRASPQAKFDAVDSPLAGPTAVLFSKTADPIESIKTLVNFLKAKEKGEVKAGFWEKSTISVAQILDIAALPGKQVLQARLVSQLASPIYKLAYIFSSQRTKLVMALSQIAKAKGGVSNG